MAGCDCLRGYLPTCIARWLTDLLPCCLSVCLSAWLPFFLLAYSIDWLTYLLSLCSDRWTDCLTDRSTDRPTNWRPAKRPTCRFVKCAIWLTDWPEMCVRVMSIRLAGMSSSLPHSLVDRCLGTSWIKMECSGSSFNENGWCDDEMVDDDTCGRYRQTDEKFMQTTMLRRSNQQTDRQRNVLPGRCCWGWRWRW